MKLLQCGDACRATKAATRRKKLVDVARKLFADNGFHGTGVAQLAAVSGIKVGQIYRDFADKEAIVAEIVESDLATFLHESNLAAAIGSGDMPAIRAWIQSFIHCENNQDARALVPEIIAEAARNERIAAIAHAINRRVKVTLLTAIEALAPRPDQANARAQIADLVLTIGAGLMHRRIADPDFNEMATQMRMLALLDDLIDRALALPPPAVHRTDHCSFVNSG